MIQLSGELLVNRTEQNRVMIAVCSQKRHLAEGPDVSVLGALGNESVSSAESKATTKENKGWGDISHIWLYLRCCFLGEEPQ